MQKQLLPFLFLVCPIFVMGQLTGSQLLEKSIQFHDPKGKWERFQGKLFVTMESSKNANRNSEITIDLPNEYFALKALQNKTLIEYRLNKEACSVALNGNTDLSEAVKKQYNLSCDRANLYKNYYTYLYGLPMKLKDPGTFVEEKVMKVAFKGKQYLVLKVHYDKKVGKDTWFFYFNPKTYALEIYQFLKDSVENTGEYILLSDLYDLQGMRIPKNRAWYYNKNDQYLATDKLMGSAKID